MRRDAGPASPAAARGRRAAARSGQLAGDVAPHLEPEPDRARSPRRGAARCRPLELDCAKVCEATAGRVADLPPASAMRRARVVRCSAVPMPAPPVLGDHGAPQVERRAWSPRRLRHPRRDPDRLAVELRDQEVAVRSGTRRARRTRRGHALGGRGSPRSPSESRTRLTTSATIGPVAGAARPEREARDRRRVDDGDGRRVGRRCGRHRLSSSLVKGLRYCALLVTTRTRTTVQLDGPVVVVGVHAEEGGGRPLVAEQREARGDAGSREPEAPMAGMRAHPVQQAHDRPVVPCLDSRWTRARRARRPSRRRPGGRDGIAGRRPNPRIAARPPPTGPSARRTPATLISNTAGSSASVGMRIS